MHSPHIIRDFDNAISGLRREVLDMASKACHSLERAVDSVLNRNVDLADAVIAADDEVDQHELDIDRRGLDILMRFHPVATDLRLVLSSMRIASNLERVGDHATSIAKRARKLSAASSLSDVTLVEPIYLLARHLLQDAISAYSDGNARLAGELHARDEDLDRLYKDATRAFCARIESSTVQKVGYLHLASIVKSLERVGDLATNIGEDVVFLEEAKDLRHQPHRSVDGGLR
jgi:phosphate transport system protein